MKEEFVVTKTTFVIQFCFTAEGWVDMMAHTAYLFVLTQIHHDLAALCDNFKHSPLLTINHQMHITYGFSGSNSVKKKNKINKNLTI